MKRLIPAVLLAMMSAPAAAQSDFETTFTIQGGIMFGSDLNTSLELDLNLGSRYLTANGALTSSTSGLSTPVSGTCFFTDVGGVFCGLQSDQNSISINLSSDLSGTINVKNEFGVIGATAPIVISGVN